MVVVPNDSKRDAIKKAMDGITVSTKEVEHQAREAGKAIGELPAEAVLALSDALRGAGFKGEELKGIIMDLVSKSKEGIESIDFDKIKVGFGSAVSDLKSYAVDMSKVIEEGSSEAASFGISVGAIALAKKHRDIISKLPGDYNNAQKSLKEIQKQLIILKIKILFLL